jgi:hypothetical protein
VEIDVGTTVEGLLVPLVSREVEGVVVKIPAGNVVLVSSDAGGAERSVVDESGIGEGDPVTIVTRLHLLSSTSSDGLTGVDVDGNGCVVPASG